MLFSVPRRVTTSLEASETQSVCMAGKLSLGGKGTSYSRLYREGAIFILGVFERESKFSVLASERIAEIHLTLKEIAAVSEY